LFAYMSRISIVAAKKQGRGEATVAGFVRNKRAHKGVIFVDLKDLSGQMQVVFAADRPEVYASAEKLNAESVIEVSGELKKKPAAKAGGTSERAVKAESSAARVLKDYELNARSLRLISQAEENLPIPVLTKIDNTANLDNRLDWRWLDLRRDENQLIFKVWTKMEESAREYFLSHGFVQIYTPCLMSTASETGAEVFIVKYFDRQAYLAQSPQFYKQMAIASGLEKVFVFGPVFRAEPSYTARHLTEFTGWDFEISYIDSEEDVMALEEDLLIAAFKKTKADLDLDITIPVKPFPRLTFKAAKEKLKAAGVKSEKNDDFSSEEEKALDEIMKKESGHDFVFVTAYPVSGRPFYHMRRDDDKNLTKSFDLFYRGLEITTGSQREHRLDVLEKQARENNMDREALKDYFNFFRYGCPSHGGAGLGPARIIMKMLDLANIKEACFLPRDVKRLRP